MGGAFQSTPVTLRWRRDGQSAGAGHPSRAAKAQIHALVRKFAADGGGVLVSSGDIAELMRICDAIVALRQGRIAARLDRSEGFDEKRLHAAIGG